MGDLPLTGIWPDFIAPPKFENPHPNWVDPRLPDFRLIWKLAREKGYAVGLHGSMKRDCDLIAAPWTEAADSAEALIAHLCEGLGAFTLPVVGGGVVCQKPHGRLTWALQISGAYTKVIDISVMPRGPQIPDLPHDVARCDTDGCQMATRCLRKSPGRGEYQVFHLFPGGKGCDGFIADRNAVGVRDA